MSSQHWHSAGSGRLDYRSLPVTEGWSLRRGSSCCRKRLRSVDEDDQESAGQLRCYGNPEEEEELPRLCQRCHIVASQLSRQAAALKDLAYASFLFHKLQRLQSPRGGRHASVSSRHTSVSGHHASVSGHHASVSGRHASVSSHHASVSGRHASVSGHHASVSGHHASVSGRCDTCGASFHQLRLIALRRALGVAMETTPPRAAPPVASTRPASDQLPPKQQRWSDEGPWRWGEVRSTYLGGGGAKGLATVTPLPLNSQHYLEGLWRVSCSTAKQLQPTGSTSDGDPVTLTTSTQGVKPATHSIATQTSQPPSAAAAFFIRAAQKLSLSRRRKSPVGSTTSTTEAPGPLLYIGGFSGALQVSPPAVPPCLLRARSKVKDTPGMGKVRVMVRICSVHGGKSSESMSILKVDARKKLLTLCETSTAGPAGAIQRRPSTSTPKTFTFDAVFSPDASQAEVCSGTLAEVIQSVVNGADGCIFCFGHANLGKTYTMIGRDCSTQSLGVAPTAVSWLFKVMEERQEKSGARFSVRVSAVEISGREETLTDLLAELASQSAEGQQEAPGPAVTLREDPLCGSQLQNQTELRASSAERAAFFLDAALAERRSSRAPSEQEARRNSHFLFTLHLNQERLDKGNKASVSGRSRLHLLDLGSCETDISRTREGGGGQCLSLSALGNVILALTNGAKHVPYRDSKLTMLLSESLSNINCRTTMIAHVSDSQASYMETLTTVQLASRIHRMRKKKSKYASSSSGGESSCEEGPSHRPPHPQPVHPKIMPLDPDTALLLSSDLDYSSSSEHSCDTVIYVGLGGVTVSDRELSDNEGPPSFVPIIPSLNKKQVQDAPRPEGDHFKCNTFAELQERLDYIDGSEVPHIPDGLRAQTKATRLTETQPNSESTTTMCANKPNLEQSKFPNSPMDAFRLTSADGETFSAVQPREGKPVSRDSEPVVREKVYQRGGVPKPSSSPSLPRTSQLAGRTPPVGVSQQALRQGQPLGSPSMEGAHSLRAALLAGWLDGDFLKTTVTLQQPVELNGEDELVFTVVEELPVGPDNGRPGNLVSLNSSSSSLQTSGSRPVSIISSINDEYDAYTCQQGPEADCQEVLMTQHGNNQLTVGSYPSDVGADSSTSRLYLRDKSMTSEKASFTLTSPGLFQNQLFLQDGIRSSLTDSSGALSPNKPFNKCPPSPDSSKTSLKVRASTLNSSAQIPRHTAHSSLPKKNQPTSPAGVSCSRQEGQHEDFVLQGSSQFDPRDIGFLYAGKPPRPATSSALSKKPAGNSNSMPRPPKGQTSSSAQRVVDGREKSNSRRGETLIKLPRLTRGATTLGTVSVPRASDGTSETGTLRFSSLGKKSNTQKSNMFSKSGSAAAPVRQSSQEQKTRTTISPSALQTSSNVGKFPKISTSEEEITHRTSCSQTEHGSVRTTSSLKTPETKTESCRYYGSLTSLESPAVAASMPEPSRECSGATSGGTGRPNRSVPRLGVPASTSASSSQAAPGATSNKLQVKGSSSSSRAAVSAGHKVRTLSAGSSKSQSSSPKPLDTLAGRNTSLPPSSKSPSRSGTGTKAGRGTIMGTKQAIGRAANTRVSELATGSQRKQDSGTSDDRESLTPLPSPYSKITAPRRPQRYSSGHGSDNSSILSGELPPAMGRTTLFYPSGGSSGYESMIRDSETTGSTSSAHDSMSESGEPSSRRVSKSPKKRGNGFQRRRLIPAPLPDSASLGRKVGAQWVDLPPLGLKEPFAIKVYEIDDVEVLQRRREAVTGSEPFHDVQKGLLYFNARLRMAEKRQHQIRVLNAKHEDLKVELEEVKIQLMLQHDKWSGDFDVDQDLERESQEYLEALTQATAELESCVNLCKSRVMMETCFDIAVTAAAAAAPGGQEVEV